MLALDSRLLRSIHTGAALSAPSPNAVFAARELIKSLNVTTFTACFCFLRHRLGTPWRRNRVAAKSDMNIH